MIINAPSGNIAPIENSTQKKHKKLEKSKLTPFT